MAVRFVAGTDQYTVVSGNYPPTSAVLWVSFWARQVANTGGFAALTRMSAGSSILYLAAGSDGHTLGWFSGAGSITPGFSLAGAGWCRVAAVHNNGAGTLYVATADGAVTVATGTITTGTPTDLGIGGRGGGDNSEPFNGDVAGWKLYAGWVPTVADVVAEWRQLAPLCTTGLVSAYPRLDATPDGRLDWAGGGRALAAGSTAATAADDPPVPLWLPRQRLVLSSPASALDAQATATTTAGITAAAARVDRAAVAASTTASASVSATRTDTAQAGTTTAAGVSVAAARIDQASSSAATTAQLAATANRTDSADAAPVVTAQLAATASRVDTATADPATTAALTATAGRVGTASAPAPVVASVVASATVTSPASAALSTAAVVVATVAMAGAPWPPTAGAIAVLKVATGVVTVR